MIDLKPTDITTEMVTLTLNTMDPGKVLDPSLKERLPHSLLHKTQSTPTSFLSRPSPEQELLMTDPKPTDIMTEMVTPIPNTMVHGKEPLLKQPHLPPHKTQSTPTNSHSRPSPEQEVLMTDPKLTPTTMETVTLTPNTMVHGAVLE